MKLLNINQITLRTRWTKIIELAALTLILGVGLVGWGAFSYGVIWLLTGLGSDLQNIAKGMWLLLYVTVAVAAFRRWSEARAIVAFSPEQRSDYLKTACSLPLGIIATLSFCAAFWLWGWQFLYWLRTEHWVTVDLISLIKATTDDAIGPRIIFGSFGNGKLITWLLYPQDWLGLNRVVATFLTWVTPSLIFLLIGIQLATVASAIGAFRDKLVREHS